MSIQMSATSTQAKVARGAVGTAAMLATIAAVGDFKSWQEFLLWAAGATGAGAVVFLIIQGLEKLNKGQPLPSTVKYYLALFLSFAVPIGAYLALVHWIHLFPFDRNELLAAIIAAIKTASTFHWEGERMEIQRAQEQVIAHRLSTYSPPPDMPNKHGLMG